ncbi:hypothetical protein [Xylella fastidiosa]|uniref:hypothetical protein n=1 Tax=Xylella fastidiosa TaxID=2371 RepID=UPI0005A8FE0B|nr:hypothetical protein [Xylella fastidiosa]
MRELTFEEAVKVGGQSWFGDLVHTVVEYAGLGAGVGAVFGPEGTAIGAAFGGLIGAWNYGDSHPTPTHPYYPTIHNIAMHGS